MTTHEEGGGDMYVTQDDEQMLVKYRTKMNMLGATVDRYGATMAAFLTTEELLLMPCSGRTGILVMQSDTHTREA